MTVASGSDRPWHATTTRCSASRGPRRQDEIQQAYRKLARRHHPDVNKDPEAEERFKEINEAYRCCPIPKTRARYDRFGEDFRQDPRGLRERVAAGAGGGFRDPADRRRRGRPAAPGTPPASARTSAARTSTSRTCSAACSAPAPAPRARSREPTRRPSCRSPSRRPTAAAAARSRSPGRPGSRGRYDVNIPPGVLDGQRIRLAGEGGRGSGDAPAGDLYLMVRIQPASAFRLDGRDIHVQLPVTPWEAALGATVPVPTPGGGRPRSRVPAGSSSGRRLRLRGQGMPQPARRDRRPVRRSQDHGAAHPQRPRARAVRGARRGSAFDPRRTR